MDYSVIERDSIDSMYKAIIDRILRSGEEVTARGLSFKECRFQHLIITNPRARLITNQARKLSKKFAMGEFIWIMSGKCNVEQIAFYNKRMADFSDDGFELHGAYGPRLRHWRLQNGDVDQLTNCLERLKNDIYTRQASIVILDPAIDFTVKTKDIPCNNYLQFIYREGKLDLMTYVRSNDTLLGFPYDVFEWTMLQEIFANALGVELGNYHHIIGSLHIYSRDIPKMNEILNSNHQRYSMAPMPKNTNLNIINDLAKAEEQYRDDNVTPVLKEAYWSDVANWLVK